MLSITSLILSLMLFIASYESRIVASYDRITGIISCAITPASDNRWLDTGVRGYLVEGYQLNGLPTDPTTHTLQLPALDCGRKPVLIGFCELWTADHHTFTAEVEIPCDHPADDVVDPS